MQWYYSVDGAQQGPITEDQFNSLVNQRSITPETLVWNETLPTWKPYGELSARTQHGAAKLKMAERKAPEPGQGDTLPSERIQGASPIGMPTLAGPARRLTATSLAALIDPLLRCRGWMKFVGILFIVTGTIQALTIVGLLLAWLPLWQGIALVKASKQIRLAQESQDPAALGIALEKLRVFFKITGILALLGLLSALVGIALAILTLVQGHTMIPMWGK